MAAGLKKRADYIVRLIALISLERGMVEERSLSPNLVRRFDVSADR